jgi:hypothetical protein
MTSPIIVSASGTGTLTFASTMWTVSPTAAIRYKKIGDCITLQVDGLSKAADNPAGSVITCSLAAYVDLTSIDATNRHVHITVTVDGVVQTSPGIAEVNSTTLKIYNTLAKPVTWPATAALTQGFSSFSIVYY